jgi:hypothetical protein
MVSADVLKHTKKSLSIANKVSRKYGETYCVKFCDYLIFTDVFFVFGACLRHLIFNHCPHPVSMLELFVKWLNIARDVAKRDSLVLLIFV